jgi:hypothetical protein
MPSQPLVPFWFAATIVVLSAMITAALAFTDPSFTFLTPVVKFVLAIVNIGLTTLAALLNIKRSAP